MDSFRARPMSVFRSDSPVWSPAKAVRRNDCAPKYRWSISPSSVRENVIPHSSSSRRRPGMRRVTVSTFAGLLRKCPSSRVPTAGTVQSSPGSWVPRAPLMPPRAQGVWASPWLRLADDEDVLGVDPALGEFNGGLGARCPGPDDQHIEVDGFVGVPRCLSPSSGRSELITYEYVPEQLNRLAGRLTASQGLIAGFYHLGFRRNSARESAVAAAPGGTERPCGTGKQSTTDRTGTPSRGDDPVTRTTEGPPPGTGR